MEVKAIESDCNQEGARGFRNVSQDVANGQRVQPEPLFPQKWRMKHSFEPSVLLSTQHIVYSA